MASITIRNLDKQTKSRLRIQAAVHGRSMEEEARIILNSALSEETESAENLASAIRKRFKPMGGVNLRDIPRESIREPLEFD